MESSSDTKTPNRKKQKRKAIPDEHDESTLGCFTVLGSARISHNQHVKRVLPYWLANPSIISCNLKEATVHIDSLQLDADLVKLIEDNFIPYFFPVQYQVIPKIIHDNCPKLLRPSDLCVSAPTGSGKTLAYVLPIIQILKNASLTHCVRAIVVLPTEVLASQVFNVIKTFCSKSWLKTFLMSKRVTFSAERDLLISTNAYGKLNSPFDIIVATPGRLVDHLGKTSGFDISRLQFLVVDEADRTLDDQEGDWLSRLESKFWSNHSIDDIVNPWKSIPLTCRWMHLHLKAFQKLLFSATLSQNPETLEKLNLFQPKLLTSIVKSVSVENTEENSNKKSSLPVSESFVGKYATPLELKESFVLCHKDTKPLIVSYIISHFNWKRVLCFTNTKESTHRLCLLLKHMGSLNVKEISAKWTPKTRDVVLKKFENGSVDILITSDQMARGIDIPVVDYVISYDLPGYTKTYIHRIGRCARAGRKGHALSLVMKEQVGVYKKTMRSAGKTNYERMVIRNTDLNEFEEKFKRALSELQSVITGEENKAKKGGSNKD